MSTDFWRTILNNATHFIWTASSCLQNALCSTAATTALRFLFQLKSFQFHWQLYGAMLNLLFLVHIHSGISHQILIPLSWITTKVRWITMSNLFLHFLIWKWLSEFFKRLICSCFSNRVGRYFLTLGVLQLKFFAVERFSLLSINCKFGNFWQIICYPVFSGDLSFTKFWFKRNAS